MIIKESISCEWMEYIAWSLFSMIFHKPVTIRILSLSVDSVKVSALCQWWSSLLLAGCIVSWKGFVASNRQERIRLYVMLEDENIFNVKFRIIPYGEITRLRGGFRWVLSTCRFVLIGLALSFPIRPLTNASIISKLVKHSRECSAPPRPWLFSWIAKNFMDSQFNQLFLVSLWSHPENFIPLITFWVMLPTGKPASTGKNLLGRDYSPIFT